MMINFCVIFFAIDIVAMLFHFLNILEFELILMAKGSAKVT